MSAYVLIELQFLCEEHDLSLWLEDVAMIMHDWCTLTYRWMYISSQVSMLVMKKLVHLWDPEDEGVSRVDWSRFRVFDKFVKKVIRNNPAFDTHRHFKNLDVEKKFMSAREFCAPQQMRALILDGCEGLEKVDLRGLRKLRLLVIRECPVLKEVTGWKYLRELGWLEIFRCRSYERLS